VTDWTAVDERHDTALLLVDVINAFFAADGAFHYDDAALVLPALEQLLAAARDGGRLVVHARESHYRGLADLEGRKLPPHCVVGESDAEFFAGFEPVNDEVELRKRRYSAFFASDLEITLRELEVDSLQLIGWSTSLAVATTAIDAWQLGFPTTVVSDLTIAHAWGGHTVDENQEWSLDYISAMAKSRIVRSDDLMK